MVECIKLKFMFQFRKKIWAKNPIILSIVCFWAFSCINTDIILYFSNSNRGKGGQNVISSLIYVS